MLNANLIPSLSSVRHVKIVELKMSLRSHLGYRKSSPLLRCRSLVCFIWSTAAHGFNNSVHSKLGHKVHQGFLLFSGFSDPITDFPLSVSFQLHKGDMIFIYKDLLTILPGSIPDKNRENYFSFKFCFHASDILRSNSQKCIFHLKSSKIQLHWAINPYSLKTYLNIHSLYFHQRTPRP